MLRYDTGYHMMANSKYGRGVIQPGPLNTADNICYSKYLRDPCQ